MKNNIIITTFLLTIFSCNLMAENILTNTINTIKEKNKRNIFESLINIKNKKNKNKINIQNTPIIERYDLSKYSLNAVLVSNKEKKILIVEKYSNSLFKLKIGDKIGKDGDSILDINKNQIIIGKDMNNIAKVIQIKILKKGNK